MRKHHSVLGGVALALALALTACSDGRADPDAQDTPTPTIPTSASTSATPTEPASDENQAAASAEETIREYYAFLDEVIADEGVDLEGLDVFLQDPELTDRTDFQQRFRDQGFYSNGGSTAFEWMKPTKVKLYPKRGEAAVSMEVCLNLNDVEVRFESGKKVNTLTPALARFEVYNYDYPSSTGWKIAVADYPGKQCRP